ncbi:unnamed protein product [Clavelina lepadiformis]|uniref:Uncharacterized protein n=1 Tax=Clavelina lepadiformis TaxID=159417 RepID=A0ABP0FBB9_CLALP
MKTLFESLRRHRKKLFLNFYLITGEHVHRQQSTQPRRFPAIITKCPGSRSVNVRILPRGLICRRHVYQLRPHYATEDNEVPDDNPNETRLLTIPRRVDPERTLAKEVASESRPYSPPNKIQQEHIE